ncbi:DNA-3-methyladenine glycosylase I [Ferrimonas lipolytica]|uniref:DNA-3-methyladenine glycosylase I n=1 Tax=Ferrimonas lipolytica TaxID=2724191 RepID=A0A6H1UHV2_9GAMM|nr:DNA-3-methyladenine glycosylase I [Ferrimonas lipolytica]QIZ78209.1 DNA-3-methyladenine glycosylase I [Ferrimonas lipolytica]
MTDIKRCDWCGVDPQYVHYHDTQWGRPEHDSIKLFEKLCLDGQQAGLSWLIILRKTENYRAAFDNFDPQKIAQYDDAKVALLLQDAGIVRNKLKVNSIIKNARAYMKLKEQGIDFADYIWSFVNYQQIVNSPKTMADIPATSPESDAMSKALKKAGFNFVGSTIVYAFMQACGLVNDHIMACPSRNGCIESR